MDSVRKPRVKWEVERDENSKFFHGLINSRRKSQTVQGIMLDGVWNFEPKDIKSAFLDFYKDKFNYHDSPVSFPPMLPAHHLSIDDHDFLESMVSMDEIKAAVWDYGSQKALGPDGYSFMFIKKLWDLLKHDIQSFMVFFSTTMAGVDIDTLTMEQYLALSRENQASGVVKSEIRGNINFEIKSKFVRELKEDTFSGNKGEDAHDHIDRVPSIVSLFNIPGVSKDAVMLLVFPFTLTGAAKRTTSRNIGSNCSNDGLAALVNKLDNLGRDMKRLKKSVHAIQVRCQFCEGPYLDKDCPLNEEVKQIKEVRYGEFGQTTPFNGNNGGKFWVGPPGYYTKTDNRPPYGERRQA
ncbi:hypothetical protein Tco_1145501 [Tanacetum coccineum]